MMIAEASAFLDAAGQASPLGIWLLMAIVVIAAVAAGTNSIFGILLKRKQLAAPAGTQINPQPLIIAMEKEFVHRRDYDAQQADLQSQIKEGRKYAHDEVHEVRNDLQLIQAAGEERDVLLHRLDERSQAHMRQIDQVNIKVDRLGDRIADKVEKLLQLASNKRRDE